VTPGTDDAVTEKGSVTCTGSTKPALSVTDLPEVEVPELPQEGLQVQSSPYPLVIPAGNVSYQALTVEDGAQVIIQGPAQVVLGSLSLGASAQLSFDTSQGAVELDVTDSLSLGPGSLLSSSSTHPEEVLIQVPGTTAQPVTLRSKGPFYGVIYAPKAAVIVGGEFEVFGALIADTLTFEGPARLHFDKHLALLAAESLLPDVLSWRLVELANISSDLSMDPFDALGVDRNVLPFPTAAHKDQTLCIDYYNFADEYHRYTGLESHFDWNVVKTVITATRDGQEVLFPRAPTNKAGTKQSPVIAPMIDGPMI